MARKVIEHRDFSGGDWGRRQAWTAPKNTFKALNMLVYSTGELGVRPGLCNITPTNVAAGNLAWGMVATGQNNYWYGQGTNMRRAQSVKNQTQSTATGTFTGTASTLYYANLGTAIYIMEPSRGVYSLALNTLTQLNAVGGNGLVLFGDRLATGYYVGTTSSIRYNGLTAGVSDLTSWPATNIIPVGDRNERPANLHLQRGHMSIMKETNGLFIITGQLGVNETLRKAVNTFGPSDTGAYSSCVTENDMIWYVANAKHHIPASFDGTVVRYFEDQLLPYQGDGLINLSPVAISDPHGVAISIGTNSSGAAFADTTKLMLFHHGAWTQHELPNLGNNSQLVSTINQGTYDPGVTSLSAENLPSLFHDVPALVFGKDGSTPAFYSLLLDMDRPGYNWGTPPAGFEALNAEMPGDDSTAQVSGSVAFPEFHVPIGDEFQVHDVVVDFRSWNTNGSLTNHFDLQVDCLRPYDNTSPISSLKGQWDQAGSLSSTGGTIQRVTFLFGEQGTGNGYQLKLSNIRGVAIQRIQVTIDTVKARGA